MKKMEGLARTTAAANLMHLGEDILIFPKVLSVPRK